MFMQFHDFTNPSDDDKADEWFDNIPDTRVTISRYAILLIPDDFCADSIV
jgi:hypothetical protein